MMRAARRAEHPSYKIHRRQVWTQILLPVLIGAAAFIGAPIAAWLTTYGGAGNVSRWAAISTMWSLIPVIMAGAILLVVLLALIFATSQISGWIPRYSYGVQRIAQRVAWGTSRAAAIVRKPVLAFREIASLARAGLQRLRERV